MLRTLLQLQIFTLLKPESIHPKSAVIEDLYSGRSLTTQIHDLKDLYQGSLSDAHQQKRLPSKAARLQNSKGAQCSGTTPFQKTHFHRFWKFWAGLEAILEHFDNFETRISNETILADSETILSHLRQIWVVQRCVFGKVWTGALAPSSGLPGDNKGGFVWWLAASPL